MATIFDSFQTKQSAPPINLIEHTDTWTPTSARQLILTTEATIDINISNEDKLTFFIPGVGKFVRLTYIYPQPIDISGLKNIRFIDVDSVGFPDYHLLISDEVSTAFLVSSEDSGTVTWKLSESVGVDLKNITVIDFEIVVNDSSTASAYGTIGELNCQTCAQSGNIIDTLLCLLSNIFSSLKKRTSRFVKRMKK